MQDNLNQPESFWPRLLELWRNFRDYMGLGRRRQEPLDNPASLRKFLETRASHVAQTSLYGYLRTRAGQRYPELFQEEEFITLLDIAKWHVWLDCLGDLMSFTGALMVHQRPDAEARIARLMQDILDDILQDTSKPADAGEEFVAHTERLKQRIAVCPWAQMREGESAFSFSPTSLVRWAPLRDDLKELDEEIVKNSVRFRWHEVKRELRNILDTDAILHAAG